MSRQTVSNIIDTITQRIGDNAQFVSRDEVLTWLSDGYARLVREGGGPRTIEAHPLPPRHEIAITHEWQRAYYKGTAYKFTFTDGDMEVTNVSQINGNVLSRTTPTAVWQLEYISGGSDVAYRFSVPKTVETILTIWYDDNLLLPISHETILRDSDYQDVTGLPRFYTVDQDSFGFDLYQIRTTSTPAYRLPGEPLGTVRGISGERTYTIQTEDTDPYGILRRVESPDRSYHSVIPWQLTGALRNIESSEYNLLVYSARTPRRDLQEDDCLDMIPDQLDKYVMYYALGAIHNRPGELFEPNMAEHYRQRYFRGVRLLSRIKNTGHRDQKYMRGGNTDRVDVLRRPRFPDNYPRVF